MPGLNFGNAAQGGLQGATLGGSIGGPWGAAIGGGLGGLAGLFGFGASDQGTPDRFTSEQKKLTDPLYGGLQDINPEGLSVLRNLLNYQPESLEDMQKPAMEQFQQEVIPSILERFSGLGARNSSAMNQALSQAGKGLTTNLAAMRAQQMQNAAGVRQNALQQLMGMNQLMLGTPYQGGRQSSPGLWETLAPITGNLLGNYLSSNMNRGSSPTGLQGVFGSEMPVMS